MGRIHKLPFIFGCSAAIIAGIISYATGADSQSIYIRMAVMMIVFCIIGSYVKNTVLTIEKEVKRKKEEQQRLEEQQLHQQMEEQKNAAARHHMQQDQPTMPQGQSQTKQQSILDLSADEDFKPLVLSKAVSSRIKE